MGQKAKSKAPMIKDCLNLTVEKISDGQILTESMRQIALEFDKVWASVKPGQRRFKRRRISADSWRYAQMYVKHQQQLKAEREASLQLAQEAVCQSDHPPQNIYTDLSFKGGVITEESQVEVCDSECASLITPPRIYIQPSFLGGGDQDLSQDSEVQELLQALPFAETVEDFASIVEHSPLEAVEEAISFQPDPPRRQQLAVWYEAIQQLANGKISQQQWEAIAAHSPPAWHEKVRVYSELLLEGVAFGLETVKALVQPWSYYERLAAVFKAEELSPEAMERLRQIEPNWSDLCVAW
jgi:hypothetical protein